MKKIFKINLIKKSPKNIKENKNIFKIKQLVYNNSFTIKNNIQLAKRNKINSSLDNRNNEKNNKYFKQIFNRDYNNKIKISYKQLGFYKRAVMINNLIKIIKNNKNYFNKYTLFKSIMLFDKYIENTNEMNNYNLIGVTCIWISNKIDNPYKINIKQLQLNEKDLIKMEIKIIQKINYRLNEKSLLEYLDYFLHKILINYLISEKDLIIIKLEIIIILRVLILYPEILNKGNKIIAVTSIIFIIIKLKYNNNIIDFLINDFNNKNRIIKTKKFMNMNYDKMYKYFCDLNYINSSPNINKKFIYN